MTAPEKYAKWAVKVEWGNIPQWIGSIAAVVTAGIAFTAYNSPVFQNQILREENSRLQIEKNSLDNMVKETSKLIWSYACTEFPLSLQITFQGYHPESCEVIR